MILISITFLTTSCSFFENNESQYDVIVVGGGLAGLTAVNLLKDYKVLLLEKEDYLGGRILTKKIDDTYYDIGASAYLDTVKFLPSDYKPEILNEAGPVGIFYANDTYLAKDIRSIVFKLYKKTVIDRKDYEQLLSFEKGKIPDIAALSSKNYKIVRTCFGNIHPGEIERYLPGFQQGCFTTYNFSHYLNGSNAFIPYYLKGMKGKVYKNSEVVSVEEIYDRVKVEYLRNNKSNTVYAKAVVVATPALVTKKILKSADNKCRAFLNSVEYGTYTKVAIGFKDVDFRDFSYIVTDDLPTNVVLKYKTKNPKTNIIFTYYGDKETRRMKGMSKDEIIDISLKVIKKVGIGKFEEENILFTDLKYWEIGGTIMSKESYSSWEESYRRPSKRIFLCGDYMVNVFPFGTPAAILSAKFIVPKVKKILM